MPEILKTIFGNLLCGLSDEKLRCLKNKPAWGTKTFHSVCSYIKKTYLLPCPENIETLAAYYNCNKRYTGVLAGLILLDFNYLLVKLNEPETSANAVSEYL